MAASRGRPMPDRSNDSITSTSAPLAPAAHHVTGQSHQHRGPGAHWLTEHALTAHSVTPSMAWPCTLHGA